MFVQLWRKKDKRNFYDRFTEPLPSGVFLSNRFFPYTSHIWSVVLSSFICLRKIFAAKCDATAIFCSRRVACAHNRLSSWFSDNNSHSKICRENMLLSETECQLHLLQNLPSLEMSKRRLNFLIETMRNMTDLSKEEYYYSEINSESVEEIVSLGSAAGTVCDCKHECCRVAKRMEWRARKAWEGGRKLSCLW